MKLLFDLTSWVWCSLNKDNSSRSITNTINAKIHVHVVKVMMASLPKTVTWFYTLELKKKSKFNQIPITSISTKYYCDFGSCSKWKVELVHWQAELNSKKMNMVINLPNVFQLTYHKILQYTWRIERKRSWGINMHLIPSCPFQGVLLYQTFSLFLRTTN